MSPRTTARTVLGVLRTPPAVTLHGATVVDSPLLADGSVDAVAVQVAPRRDGDDALQPRSGTPQAAARYGIDLAELAERAGLTGAAGEAFTVHLPLPVGSSVALPWAGLPPRIVLVGVGDESPTALRRAGAALARATRGLRRVAATVGAQTHHDEQGAALAARAVVEGYLLAAYTPPRLTAEPAEQVATELVLLGRDGEQVAAAVDAARIGAGATWLVRDLANMPSNIKDPAWMADRARRLGSKAGLDVQVLGPRELTAGGFGGILAVGAGSASSPRLVRLTYTPAAGGGRHVVVVGKGITYDTGGLSIKPREAMVPMKTDMAGSAVALATVLAAAQAGVPHKVTAVLPLAENHVGAASYRPGDVVTVHGGTTVEIANTDAEGRLVLADALAWADATLDPDVLVDVATLTGAASLGLGKQHAALYGTDDALVAGLEAAAERTGELVWHMPLVADYEEAVRSSVADLRHVPEDRRIGGGSITAALFLRRFVGERSWAHLDIAGPGRSTSDKHEVTEGATGFGARLLLEFLTSLD
ncbi:leucyl aminopeptidase family protein [Cellulomonas wangsupingiae]|uniref:Probable cytosol aminopeptidase n=1 Tax=Cellulomonas wangsupingiae TaxID=2968085 RepID=A0ABY5KAF5_9CELL|nr:leucyl aminopeptidase family protein [Cellulomonas wangsupingiae]MCC2334447.1 leucyl aminopeptidase family protein [Cellulomonas wangsupingiae]UUI66112.1 leucyl aminopeptidase family protein [Cellulomonas wangsupingiae]